MSYIAAQLRKVVPAGTRSEFLKLQVVSEFGKTNFLNNDYGTFCQLENLLLKAEREALDKEKQNGI